MELRPFTLERYFSRHELTAKYMLGSSDPESMTVGDLLALAPGAAARLHDLRLGYTDYCGDPALRAAIARRYTATPAERVMVFTGAEEPIFAFMNVALRAGDHLVAHAPGYQSHVEVARAIGAHVSLWPADEAKGWSLDPDRLASLVRPETKVILVNVPHNPTGFLFDRGAWDAVVAIARRAGAWLFSDEVYRGLEHDPAARLPAACDLYERAVSLDGVSKSCGLAGLRIGWIATHDRDLFARLGAFKDYLTISNAAPSELLATIAVDASETLFARCRALLAANLDLLAAFLARHPTRFSWTRPRAGSTAFVRWHGGGATAWCDALLGDLGVMLVPGVHFDWGDDHLRFGYGRRNLAEVLGLVEAYVNTP